MIPALYSVKQSCGIKSIGLQQVLPDKKTEAIKAFWIWGPDRGHVPSQDRAMARAMAQVRTRPWPQVRTVAWAPGPQGPHGAHGAHGAHKLPLLN